MGVWVAAIGSLLTIIIGVYKIWFSKAAKRKKLKKELNEITEQQKIALANNNQPFWRELDAVRLQLADKIRRL